MTEATSKKRFLLTGARSYITLDLARQLKTNGHKVFVADSSDSYICQYSNAVEKSFTIPSPRFKQKAFIQRLQELVSQYQIDIVIPICEEIFYLSQAVDQFPDHCHLFSPTFEILESLHNKWAFTQMLKEHGFATPTTFLLRSNEDLNTVLFNTPYVLKACYGRASQQVIKMYPNMPVPSSVQIEEHNPWLAQEWLEGERFCSFNVCSEGKILAHSTYPVEYAIKGTSCLSFKSVKKPSILEWTRLFVEKINFTGQIAFDFIQTEEGILYCIECNPRSTSGLHLFGSDDRLDEAFLGENTEIIFPKEKTAKQLAIGMLLYGWQQPPENKECDSTFLQTLFKTKDIIFDKKDLKPFFYMPLICLRIWRESRKLKKNLPATFTHDIEWNNEPPS